MNDQNQPKNSAVFGASHLLNKSWCTHVLPTDGFVCLFQLVFWSPDQRRNQLCLTNRARLWCFPCSRQQDHFWRLCSLRQVSFIVSLISPNHANCYVSKQCLRRWKMKAGNCSWGICLGEPGCLLWNLSDIWHTSYLSIMMFVSVRFGA